MLQDLPSRSRFHRWVILWLVSVSTMFTTATKSTQGQGPPLPSWTPLGPGRFETTIHAQGWPWRFRLLVPSRYDGQEPLPMVLVLHGSGGSGAEMLDKAGWTREAERGGFLVLAPDALPMRPRLDSNPLLNPRRWNSGQLKEGPRTRINDSAALVEMIDLVGRFWRIDRGRIYVAGHSNGGSMAFRLAIDFPERFAAIASVAGIPWQPELVPARPLPTLFLLGTADPLLPVEGGKSVLPWEVRQTPPIRRVLARWALALNGPDEPEVLIEAHEGRIIHHYIPDPDLNHEGAELIAVYLNGQGHAWPGAKGMALEQFMGPVSGDTEATPLLWNFFQRHINLSFNPGTAGILPTSFRAGKMPVVPGPD